MHPDTRTEPSGHADRIVEGLAWRALGIGGLILARLLAWQELARQRRALLEMDERMLKDIGLRREDALREAARAFWDRPPDWPPGR